VSVYAVFVIDEEWNRDGLLIVGGAVCGALVGVTEGLLAAD